MKKSFVLAIVSGLIVAACAKSPDAIAPVSMAGAYDKVSCAQARTLLAQENTTLAALDKQQKDAMTGDAIGVFLVLVPMSSAIGGDKAGEIATSKGKINALEARLLTCH